MIVLLFRFIRKINIFFKRCYLKWKVFCYTKLAKGRFTIHNSLKAGDNFKIRTDLSATALCISKNITFKDGVKILLGHAGKVSIGTDCFFNNNCSINCFGIIEIGKNNQFGENVVMYDHNHQFADNAKLISEQGYKIGKILIGNNCWIGSNVTILKDVVIGDNVIIGAGCILHKSIPSDSIVVNNQDLVIKSRN